MPARRRDPRYRLSKPFEGSFLFFQEVDVERRDDREVTVCSNAPIGPGQSIPGPRSTVQVQVAESSVIIVDGSVRYRLRLDILS
jgi:hypothetical protein